MNTYQPCVHTYYSMRLSHSSLLCGWASREVCVVPMCTSQPSSQWSALQCLFGLSFPAEALCRCLAFMVDTLLLPFSECFAIVVMLASPLVDALLPMLLWTPLWRMLCPCLLWDARFGLSRWMHCHHGFIFSVGNHCILFSHGPFSQLGFGVLGPSFLTFFLAILGCSKSLATLIVVICATGFYHNCVV
jgi:hypothetical protein